MKKSKIKTILITTFGFSSILLMGVSSYEQNKPIKQNKSIEQNKPINVVKELHNRRDTFNNAFYEVYKGGDGLDDTGVAYYVPRYDFPSTNNHNAPLYWFTSGDWYRYWINAPLGNWEYKQQNKPNFDSKEQSLNFKNIRGVDYTFNNSNSLNGTKLRFKFKPFSKQIEYATHKYKFYDHTGWKKYRVGNSDKGKDTFQGWTEENKMGSNWLNFSGYGINDYSSANRNNFKYSDFEVNWNNITNNWSEFVIFEGQNINPVNHHIWAKISLFLKKTDYTLHWKFKINTSHSNDGDNTPNSYYSLPRYQEERNSSGYSHISYYKASFWDSGMSGAGYQLGSIAIGSNYVSSDFNAPYNEFKNTLEQPININSDESRSPTTPSNQLAFSENIKAKLKPLREKYRWIFNNGVWSDLTFDNNKNLILRFKKNQILSEVQPKFYSLDWTFTIPWSISLTDKYYSRNVRQRVILKPGQVPAFDLENQTYKKNARGEYIFEEDKYELVNVETKDKPETRIYHAPVGLTFTSTIENNEVMYVNGEKLDILNNISTLLLRDGRYDLVEKLKENNPQNPDANQEADDKKPKFAKNEYLLEVKRDNSKSPNSSNKEITTIYAIKIIIDNTLNKSNFKYFAWNPSDEKKAHQKLWITPTLKNGKPNPEYNPNIDPSSGTIKKILWVRKRPNFPFQQSLESNETGYIAEGSVSYKGISQEFSKKDHQQVDRNYLGEVNAQEHVVKGEDLNLIKGKGWVQPSSVENLYVSIVSVKNQIYQIVFEGWEGKDITNLYAYLKTAEPSEKTKWLDQMANQIYEAWKKYNVNYIKNWEIPANNQFSNVRAFKINEGSALLTIGNLTALTSRAYGGISANQVVNSNNQIITKDNVKKGIEYAIARYGSELNFETIKSQDKYYNPKNDIDPDTDNTYWSNSGWYQYNINKKQKSFGAKIVQIREENPEKQPPTDILDVLNPNNAIDFWKSLQGEALIKHLKTIRGINEETAKKLNYEQVMAYWSEMNWCNAFGCQAGKIPLLVDENGESNNSNNNSNNNGNNYNPIPRDPHQTPVKNVPTIRNRINLSTFLITGFKTNQKDPAILKKQALKYINDKLKYYNIDASEYTIGENEQFWKELTAFNNEDKRTIQKFVSVYAKPNSKTYYGNINISILNSLDYAPDKVIDLSDVYFRALVVNSQDANYLERLAKNAIREYLKRYGEEKKKYTDFKYNEDFVLEITLINNEYAPDGQQWAYNDLVWNDQENTKKALILVKSVDTSLKTINYNNWNLTNSSRVDPKKNPVLTNCDDQGNCEITGLPGKGEPNNPFSKPPTEEEIAKQKQEQLNKTLSWTLPIAFGSVIIAAITIIIIRLRKRNKFNVKQHKKPKTIKVYKTKKVKKFKFKKSKSNNLEEKKE